MISRISKDHALPAKRALVLLAALLAAFAMAIAAAPKAQAATPWDISTLANSSVAPGGQIRFQIGIENVPPTDGSEITFRTHLAPGLTGVSAIITAGMTCGSWLDASTIECKGAPSLEAGGNLEPVITASAGPGACGTLTSTFEVDGGGLDPASTAKPVNGACDAKFGFSAFDFTIPDGAGGRFTQAAGHPYSTVTEFDFTTRTNPNPVIGVNDPVEDVKDVIVDLPAGLFGNPSGLEQCNLVDLIPGGIIPTPLCPVGSQVGVAQVRSGVFLQPVSLFNMEPPPGVPARFAFNVAGTIVAIDAHVRASSDYGLRVGSVNLPQALQVTGNSLTFWGVPFDPAHDPRRGCPGDEYPSYGGESCSAQAEPAPFFRMPTSCTEAGEGLPVSGMTDSWPHPGAFDETAIETHEAHGYPYAREDWGAPLGTDGCEEVPFEPSFSASPTTNQADSPSGLNVDIGLPSDCWDAKPTVAEAEESICQSDLREAEVTLPEGMVINPSAASGRDACSPQQAGLITPLGASPVHFDEAPVSCPEASKLGSVELTTPLLKDPFKGAIYLAKQTDNPFGSMLATYLVVEGSGVVIKQAGEISTDPNTGRLTTGFTEVPQAPFSKLHVELFGGPRAALRTPASCGTHTATAKLTPWSGNAAANLSDSFNLSGCGGGFDPKLTAGTQNPLAGAFSPFHLRLSRADGTAELGSLRLTLPPGLVASLKDVAYCPDSTLAAISAAPGTGQREITSPSCPPSSLVGTVTTGAGSGPTPFYTQAGKAYWSGPYKGAPVSLAVVVPAVAGPFDLGNVVVRNRFEVDPETAKITAVSDPFPRIREGIPLDVRDVRLDLDRPNYTLNPTSCEALAFAGQVGSPGGQSADRSVRFQAAGCDRLAFKPKLSLKLSGKTNRGAHPALEATVTMKRGANLASAVVALPHSEFLDQGHIGTVCTRVQYAAGAGGGAACPKRSVYGHARAYSPILGYYLQGPVFLRSSAHELPDLVLSLHGPPAQPIQVDAVGRVDSTKGGGIRTSFEQTPDVPVSKVVIEMRGGKKGLLQNSTDICQGTHRATAEFEAHNGALADLAPALKAQCGAKQKKRSGKGAYRR